MSESTVDRILDVLDAGLQSSDEVDYGDHVPDGYCWRCRARSAPKDSTAGVCRPCRAYLLADVDEEPTHLDPPAFLALAAQAQRDPTSLTPEQVAELNEKMRVVADACRAIGESLATAGRQIAETLDRVLDAFAPLIEHQQQERRRVIHRPCPRHGPTHATGGLCRPCSRGR